MPCVLNKKRDVIPHDAIYVGRPGKWGNPFKMRREADRDEVITRYRRWLTNNKKLMAQLCELRGKDLVCFCAPKHCHADVLLELANSNIRTPRAHKPPNLREEKN